jgi:hypothetical protein
MSPGRAITLAQSVHVTALGIIVQKMLQRRVPAPRSAVA